MVFNKNQKTAPHQESIKFKKSTLAMCIMALSTGAFAQDAATSSDEQVEEIIVQGVRQSLENAQEIKRNADTFVDSITASDIGALPDRSVLEAMQRVPGVSIERFAAANDPDHFGVEGSGAVVRGMTQTRSEFNGRDSFTANSGRGLSFQDVPPELMAGVDVYKNQTADMIEGGIAGTISLRTRKPFDSDGRKISISADVTYGDMVDEYTPTYSGLFSDTWETDAGKFGALFNFSNSHLEASSNGIQTDRYEFRPLAGRSTSNVEYPGFTYVDTPYVYDGSFLDVPGGLYDAESNPNGTKIGTSGVLVPNGANLTIKNDERDRKGFGAAFQWESPDETLVATAQYMRSDATLAWTENSLKYQTGFNNQRTYGNITAGEQYEFDSNGVFESGSLTDVADDWRGDNNRIPDNKAGQATSVAAFGHRFQTDSRYKKTDTLIDDYAFNLKWTPSDRWEFELDLQHIAAETRDDDAQLMFMTHAIQKYDTSGGDTPSLDIISPWSYATPAALEAHAADGTNYATDSYFTDITSYNYNAAMDHYERSEGNSDAARIDATYNFDDESMLTKVKFGVRHAEREQDVRYTKYNWGALAPIWQTTGWLDSALVQQTDALSNGMTSQYKTIDWSDFYRGGVVSIQGGNKTLHPTDALVRDYANWGTYFEPMYAEKCDDWRPVDARISSSSTVVDNECNDIPANLNGYFLPNEINLTKETNDAAYVRLDFEAEPFDRRLAGNIGVRVVRISDTTNGNTVYPDLVPSSPAPEGWDWQNFNPADYNLFDVSDANGTSPDAGKPSGRFLGEEKNYLADSILGFANDATVANEAERSFTETLPSLNLKYELNDDMVVRFATSKAIALPDLGDLRNYMAIGVIGDTINTSYFSDFWGPDNPHPDAVDANGDPLPGGVPLGTDGKPLKQVRLVNPSSIDFAGWKASGGNPYLKPMKSTQYDLSFEWYFANAGSITTSLFYKDLSDFFINGAFDRTFTNPVSGESASVRVAGPINGGKGKMEGFEINYQQFYDMLPAPWDGFGIQANYSYIKARGVPNSNLEAENPEGSRSTDSFAFSGDLPLEGQSDHTANLILMYQKNDFEARVAYNWRSEYLITTRDVITTLPVYNEAAGFMDASIFYNITDNVKIGLQGVNLLDTQTETYQQVDENLKLGRSWFVNDRRYTLVVRANF